MTSIRERFSRRAAIIGVAWVATIAVASLLTYVLCMQHPSDASDKNDAEVRAVIEQYIDALNTGDLTRIGSLSTGLAEEELNPQARAGYVRKMAYQIEKHGPMHIHDFSILARGDIVYVAYVYTEYEDQKNPKPEDIYFSPGARVRYNMYRTGGKWKVMSVDRYIGDER
ncbi:Uncharacterised protein [Mycobacteroides abscessus subsp. bolletii]|nr:nuclear transport factor 2 family protein [Mycobacteroides abscessus subsp. massiliense]QSM01858.1 hypothetical protein PROPHIGD79-1_70 [Mycobacterium phage prophi79-1]SKT22402.1 Uncharacterised protein [Mycobacteroides abscessus subsp. bolletii]SLF56423.1 Uncharacterised protein [Mycobacteroides abscessus subsp. bolletii]